MPQKSVTRRLLAGRRPTMRRPELRAHGGVRDRARRRGRGRARAEPAHRRRGRRRAARLGAGWPRRPRVAFVGGPVQQHEAVFGLARVSSGSTDSDAWQPLVGRIGTVDLGARSRRGAGRPRVGARVRRLLGVGPRPARRRARTGTAGTSSTRCPDDLLTHDPATLWRPVLRRQGGDLAVAANYPLDTEPTAN